MMRLLTPQKNGRHGDQGDLSLQASYSPRTVVREDFNKWNEPKGGGFFAAERNISLAERTERVDKLGTGPDTWVADQPLITQGKVWKKNIVEEVIDYRT